jgi:hypothetical protein
VSEEFDSAVGVTRDGKVVDFHAARDRRHIMSRPKVSKDGAAILRGLYPERLAEAVIAGDTAAFVMPDPDEFCL